MVEDRIKKAFALLSDEPRVPEEPVEIDMQPWRERIDQIDLIVLDLLNERSKCANNIGHIKKKLDLPVYVPKREVQVLDQVRSANQGPLPDEVVRRLFERIIDETRALERHIYQDDAARD